MSHWLLSDRDFQKTFILEEVGEEDEDPWAFVGNGDSGQFLVTSWDGE